MRRREVVLSAALVTSSLLLPLFFCLYFSANIAGSLKKPNMKPGRASWKKLQPAEKEIVAEVAKQLRIIGDKYNMKQKVLNIVTKILSPGT